MNTLLRRYLRERWLDALFLACVLVGTLNLATCAYRYEKEHPPLTREQSMRGYLASCAEACAPYAVAGFLGSCQCAPYLQDGGAP